MSEERARHEPGMSAERLPASTMAPAILRMVAAAGGFATVLARGSAHGSAMVIVHRHQGLVRALERVPGVGGALEWRVAAEGEEAAARFAASQQRFDPDLWIIELDIPDPARFVPAWPARD